MKSLIIVALLVSNVAISQVQGHLITDDFEQWISFKNNELVFTHPHNIVKNEVIVINDPDQFLDDINAGFANKKLVDNVEYVKFVGAKYMRFHKKGVYSIWLTKPQVTKLLGPPI